ncbi:SCO family protein [Sphingobacterium sp.]|uniref:SCO family protein n=1 Tax=Sphingobacterium sp. TaxID=341027 RepID=UPI0028B2098B|nr:SCO family protein [Sphingobacterium sp.]
MMKNLLMALFAFGLLAQACQNAETSTQVELKQPTLTDSLSDLSVYNLPSHWTNQNGQEMELKDLKGNVVVAVMIYTSCKAACPRLVADMRHIEKTVKSKNKDKIKFLLVSIDPKVDTPERLKQFAIENEMDGEQWIFLRSNEEDTREFAATLAVNYKQISPIDFSHSNIISLFNAQGELVYQQEGLGVDYAPTIDAIEKEASKI